MLDRTQPGLPMKPDRPGATTHLCTSPLASQSRKPLATRGRSIHVIRVRSIPGPTVRPVLRSSLSPRQAEMAWRTRRAAAAAGGGGERTPRGGQRPLATPGNVALDCAHSSTACRISRSTLRPDLRDQPRKIDQRQPEHHRGDYDHDPLEQGAPPHHPPSPYQQQLFGASCEHFPAGKIARTAQKTRALAKASALFSAGHRRALVRFARQLAEGRSRKYRVWRAAADLAASSDPDDAWEGNHRIMTIESLRDHQEQAHAERSDKVKAGDRPPVHAVEKPGPAACPGQGCPSRAYSDHASRGGAARRVQSLQRVRAGDRPQNAVEGSEVLPSPRPAPGTAVTIRPPALHSLVEGWQVYLRCEGPRSLRADRRARPGSGSGPLLGMATHEVFLHRAMAHVDAANMRKIRAMPGPTQTNALMTFGNVGARLQTGR